MKYDVIIIGAGVIGSAIARKLSQYQLKILVLEKENDVCEGTTCANSAIVHSGYDPEPNTLKAKLNVSGNKMYDQLCDELDVQFRRNGSITLANDDEEIAILEMLYERGKQNGVEVHLLERDELIKIEPNITKKVKKGLFAPSAGIVNPFELNVALMENAIDNGVELSLKNEVKNIQKVDNTYLVSTNIASYQTNYLINASGVYADIINGFVNEQYFTIMPRKGEYYLLDHFDDNFIKHTLFNVPSSKGKGVIVAPTTSYNYIVGPSSDFIDTRDDVSTTLTSLIEIKEKAKDLVDYIDYSKQIREFSGIRSVSSTNDFVIDSPEKGFINVAGIQSPGLTAAPAIAEMVSEMIENKELKENYNPRRRPVIRMKNLSIDEKNEVIKKDNRYGRIVCRCEKISEGEIVDCIKRNCGATTIKGVKKRVRAGFGKCQGGFCEGEVLKILVRELGMNPEEIEYAKTNSQILIHELGGKNNE